ncbi:DUF3299 domain-containing protein [Tepidicaulis sp.]|uniref:DUF3299 domain-containing protein n=1 Tax=Tepidicaulis sp. TaxID=1920809 RepID=UPI003B597913
MMFSLRHFLFLAAFVLSLGAVLPLSAAEDEGEQVTLSWEDLMPPGEEERLMELYEQQMSTMPDMSLIPEGSAADKPIQFGTYNVVEDLNGKNIRIPGFMVPFELNAGEVTEFLLVPYFGACIHVPPPPPNQIIYVTAKEDVLFTWDAVWIEGVLKTDKHLNDLGNAAYTLELTKVEAYES